MSERCNGWGAMTEGQAGNCSAGTAVEVCLPVTADSHEVETANGAFPVVLAGRLTLPTASTQLASDSFCSRHLMIQPLHTTSGRRVSTSKVTTAPVLCSACRRLVGCLRGPRRTLWLAPLMPSAIQISLVVLRSPGRWRLTASCLRMGYEPAL